MNTLHGIAIFVIGIIFGMMIMSVFSYNSYNKGFSDGFGECKRRVKEILLEMKKEV